MKEGPEPVRPPDGVLGRTANKLDIGVNRVVVAHEEGWNRRIRQGIERKDRKMNPVNTLLPAGIHPDGGLLKSAHAGKTVP